jgi:tagaturonate reductase
VDVISRTVEPFKDWNAYLKLAENPDFRFVISNTTESGICFNGEDKAESAPNVTFPAKVALLLKKRFELGLKGFIFLPCELIDKNGATLKQYIIDYAKLWGWSSDFCAWVENDNIFCNTLVDRIVTGYPRGENIELGYEDNMLNTSELFHLWVIEGPQQVGVEFPFAKTGLNVILTDNMTPYRTRKVRILNGSHTSMIPYAMLEGLETVGDCMADEKMSKFLRGCLFEEIIPTLDLPEEELLDYANNVLERFRNPYIRHLCSSICLNSVSKFKVRVLPSILEYIKRKNEMPKYLILSFAKLIEFYKNGTPIDDPAIIEEMKKSDIPAILANKAFWDEDLSFLADAVMNASAEGLV